MRLSRAWLIGLLAVKNASVDVSGSRCDSSEVDNQNCATEYGNLFSVSDGHPLKHEIISLAQWVIDLGGFVNPNQVIELVDEVSEGYGVIATNDIEKGDLIYRATPDSITGSVDYAVDDDIVDIQSRLALAVHAELFDPDFESPYVDYLEKLPREKLPEFWSDAGKELLQKVVGNNLPPLAFTDGWEIGGIEEEMVKTSETVWEPDEQEAYNLMVEYNQLDNMVPILDLYNHRNGKYLNTYFVSNLAESSGFSVYASRDIKKGQQIYVSFNKCNLCDNEEEPLDTAGLFHYRGFVENYPQSWVIGANLEFDIEESESSPGQLRISFEEKPGPTYNDVSFLMDELERMSSVAEEEKDKNNELIPGNELINIWRYYDSLITAIKLVIDSYDPSSEPSEDAYIVDADDRYFRENRYTCYDWLPTGPGYERRSVDTYRSQYQRMDFFGTLKHGDKCLDLDGTLQICNGYRPHYHEPFVHFPAVFLSSLRRVVFVGGGDSMLLHEVLKYPSLELVVGLELDQKVVRNSFKHFNTLPHFNDDRVEWWFGDATKSLNIIPKEYFGSFDLVMVDLSETVMSFTVTKNLDMLEALALLTKPDGIFVKNEHYFSKIQTMFDHTVELHLNDNPMICDQHFAMGSNKIEFMQPDFNKINGIETLLYKPLENISDHYDMIIQYAHNDAETQGKCAAQDEADDEVPNDSIPGIAMILDAEQAPGASESSESIKESVEKLAKEHSLNVISSKILKNKNNQSVVTVVMEEGFIIGRIWEKLDYIAFDIHFWGKFEKLNSIKFSLLETVGSKDWSSYRVVVGGMIGSHTWKDDKPKVGPNIVNSRNCDPFVENETSNIENNNSLALKESSSLVDSSKAILVLCGNDAQSCQSLQALRDSKENLKLIALLECLEDNSEKTSDDEVIFYVCNGDFENLLYKAVSSKENIGTIYIDESASSFMTKRVIEISIRTKHKENLFDPSVLYIAPQLQDFSEERQSVLPNIRQRFFKDRISLIEMKLWGSGEKIISFLSINQIGFFSHVSQLKHQIMEATGLNAEISTLKGDQIKHQYNFSPHFYDIDDYDRAPGMEQYFNQRSLGYQAIFQLGISLDNMKSSKMLFDIFQSRILAKNFEIIDSTIFEAVGDGCLIIYHMQEGQVLVTWNGGGRVDVNIFTYEEEGLEIDDQMFLDDDFLKNVDLSLMLRDEQPRGIGRVVNRKSETNTYNGSIECYDDYYSCQEMADSNMCESDGEYQSFMQNRCKASCGVCDNVV